MTRICSSLLLLALPLTFTNASHAGDGKAEKTSANVQWAKGVAIDFWESMTSGKSEAALGLLTPQLKKSLDDAYRSLSGAVGYLSNVAKQYETYSLSDAKHSPDANEVVVHGILSGKDEFSGKEVKADFRMRIVKNAKGEQWSIRFFLVKRR